MEDLWPVFGLRLTTPRLELRLPSEQEAVQLATRVPDDLEQDPAWPGPSPSALPGSGILQGHWRALGTWKADHWRLPLGVWCDGEPVGIQELEAERFSVLRSVETASWLVKEARGKGIGKEMRAAVLVLAFDHLGAELATSGAWEWNAASLGVSRSLGYADNGWGPHEHEGRVGVMRRVILPKSAWTSGAHPAVRVENLDRCRSWFGSDVSPTA